MTNAVPDPATQGRGVTVEEIISGTRCSPLTLKEFEGFLIHVEYSVENLQFTVWYRSYCERFAALPAANQALSEPPSERYRLKSPSTSINMSGVNMSGVKSGSSGKFNNKGVVTPGGSKLEAFESEARTNEMEKNKGGKGKDELNGHSKGFRHVCLATDFGGDDEANQAAPSTSISPPAPAGSSNSDPPLPFVNEINMIVATFFVSGSPKELNIDAKLRKNILNQLQPLDDNGRRRGPLTTHPDVFKDAAQHVYSLMEGSLPHYLTWVKGNTNTPKVLFWYAVGMTDIGIGLLVAMISLYFAQSRWWRLFSFLFFQFGVMQSYSASRYFCSQVHGRAARQLYPWELSAPSESAESLGMIGDSEAPIPTFKINFDNDNAAKQNPSFNISASSSARDLSSEKPWEKPWEKPEETLPQQTTKSGMLKTPGVFRSKIFAMWKKSDGERVPVFGPERVVEDPYIQYLHNQQIKEILIVGAVATFLFECIVLAIPERTPL